ncbi:hypothetical protein P154DRAFT_70774 [Amniculicola lignicola CBS 123094]|uniref:Uncharacterized protein n=1 Tax=Amniculicola lignicola CBS 123094 TaxID=1392246 RepID=A0A6A5VVR1_9PLEO|nr:hypothetical protein P154DRAFT_70774 [Amniculicola lignicola CBS 123094]
MEQSLPQSGGQLRRGTCWGGGTKKTGVEMPDNAPRNSQHASGGCMQGVPGVRLAASYGVLEGQAWCIVQCSTVACRAAAV